LIFASAVARYLDHRFAPLMAISNYVR
jgi:hypothetical protein